MVNWFPRPYVLAGIISLILLLFGVVLIYPLATGDYLFWTIFHISFTPDGSKLLVSRGERNRYHDYAQASEIVLIDTQSWKSRTLVPKGRLLTPPQTIGYLRKSNGFITITREPPEFRSGAPFFFPFPAFSGNVYAAPNPAGQPHVLLHWDYSGNILKRVQLTKQDIPEMDWYDDVTDLALDSEDKIMVAATTPIGVILWGLKNLIAGSRSWAVDLRTQKRAWTFDKGYPQAKASPDGKTCLCCRTACPFPYETQGKPDLTAELKLFEFESGKMLAEFRSQKFEPLFANWWGDKNKVLLLTNTRKLLLLTAQLGYERDLLQSGMSENPIQLTTDSKGDVIVIADKNKIEIHSGRTWKLQYSWETSESERLFSAACSPDGKYVAWAVTRYGSFRMLRSYIYIFDIEGNKIITVIK